MPSTVPFTIESDTLPDGRVVHFRPLEKEDREALHSAFHKLSDDSVRNRFFNAKLDLTDSELRFLTEVDFSRHVALVAELDIGGQVVGTAVGRFVRLPDNPLQAEFALTVADEYQGQGIGRALLKQIIKSARELGVTRLDAMVLAENHRMVNLMKHLGLKMQISTEDGVSTLTLEL